MGRCNGREGIFPAQYVEKIADNAPTAPPRYPASNYSPPAEKAVYRPFGAALHGNDMPPPSTVNSVGLQQDPAQQEKKSKFGGLGGTVRHSVYPGLACAYVSLKFRWLMLLLEALASVQELLLVEGSSMPYFDPGGHRSAAFVVRA